MAAVQVRQGDSLRTEIRLRDHVLIADEPVDSGGENAGPMPTEMLLGALGACIAVTCRLYAKRKDWPLTGVSVDVAHEKLKADEYPAYQGESDVVNEFRLTIGFEGELSDEQRARLLEIAGKCPVHRMLQQPNFFVDELLAADEALPD